MFIPSFCKVVERGRLRIYVIRPVLARNLTSAKRRLWGDLRLHIPLNSRPDFWQSLRKRPQEPMQGKPMRITALSLATLTCACRDRMRLTSSCSAKVILKFCC